METFKWFSQSASLEEQWSFSRRCKHYFYIVFFFALAFVPSADGSESPRKLYTMIYLADLREIDGSRQSFSADVGVRLRWNDPKLVTGEGARVIPLTSAWNPGVQIINRLTVQTTLPEVLEVDSVGNVTYRQRFIGQFSTFMDLRQFPFDKQTLTIGIVTPGKSPADIEFIQDHDPSGIANRLSITDWKIGASQSKSQSYPISPGRDLAGFVFELNVIRQFRYFLVQIIIPMGLILGMSWIVFWIDLNQTGPRISISITSMLTLVAYRLLTGSFLPRLPFLTRMDYFVFGCTTLVFMSLLNVVWISRMLLANQQTRATRLDTHSRWFFPFLFFLLVSLTFAWMTA